MRFHYVLLAALALHSCGNVPDERIQGNRVVGIPNGTWSKTLNESGLEGAWRSECLRDSGRSISIEVRIFSDRTLYLTQYFQDLACRSPRFLEVIRWNRIPEAVPSVPGRFDLNTELSKPAEILFLPQDREMAETMQKGRVCGEEVWSMNQARSVLNSSCAQEIRYHRLVLVRSNEDSNQLRLSRVELENGKWTVKSRHWLRRRL